MMPLMHEHESVCHHTCEDHEDSEPLHTGEKCLACVFANTYAEFDILPILLSTPTNCCDTPIISEVGFLTFNPTANIHSRAPPIFSN